MKKILTAALGIALAFTVSCSDDKDDEVAGGTCSVFPTANDGTCYENSMDKASCDAASGKWDSKCPEGGTKCTYQGQTYYIYGVIAIGGCAQ